MSKTIEFVEKSIKKQTKKLEELKRQKEHYEILHNSNSIISYTPHIVSIDLEISNIEFNLEHIKQIKTDLEAWEVVKDNVDVYGHEYNGELVEYVQITEEQLPDEKHINIIKKAKALEEENV